ncbi:bifunctional DNA-formamidopyrimidine glycosylase/DNA-(apurinic or apyrimidinic site) lyase [Actinomyces slackii]|uniref:Formamidopyrimidine-DNA glycosylase n=1 Tax=Actinomyces slackii TaxID=52774 RepID=A0A3S4SPR0_9ACTO|nr:bifunctional DNA-formamidopyrimidine glycosylase/DNA-(apurinic or apyrimidinic site) lyase [Actinomyces slackii]VEG74920.1 Formamidopyrimidine-DNA glycosylase [Actinomyces slackii]
MPELPEVESVRAGLARHVVGRTVAGVEVLDARPLRRQVGGAQAFTRELEGRAITAAVRRGKFLWLALDDGRALSAHLGMSGQLLVRGTSAGPGSDAPDDRSASGPVADGESFLGDPAAARVDLTATRAPSLVRDLSAHPRHLRVRLHLSARPGDPGTGAALDLVDQRMLGGLHVVDLAPTADGAPGGQGSQAPLLPADATHIARDLLDPFLDRGAAVARMRASRRGVKTLLMDQGIVSGVGNIYADEGLWRARLHGLRPGRALGPRVALGLLEATAQVMEQALAVGGTSFDALYVDAEGAAGFFARQLQAYGRAGQECRRCGAVMRGEIIAGRSHAFCPRCQTRPRGGTSVQVASRRSGR